MSKTAKILLLTCIILLVLPCPAWAYIGPGAGFALAGSFMAALTAIFSAILFNDPLNYWVSCSGVDPG